MTRDYPDYSRTTIPSQRMAQSWAPPYYGVIQDNIPAATAKGYEMEYPDDDYIYTLVYVSGWFNSLEPMMTKLYVGETLVMLQRQKGGWYKQFIRGALIRLRYPDVLTFEAYNHRASTYQLVVSLVHYKELG